MSAWRKAWNAIVRWWRWIVVAIVAIATVFGTATMVRAIRARVERRRQFREVPGRPDLISLEADGTWIEVKLPRNVSIGQVVAAGIGEYGEWAVEVLHEPTDRRGDPNRGRDSDLGL